MGNIRCVCVCVTVFIEGACTVEIYRLIRKESVYRELQMYNHLYLNINVYWKIQSTISKKQYQYCCPVFYVGLDSILNPI